MQSLGVGAGVVSGIVCGRSGLIEELGDGEQEEGEGDCAEGPANSAGKGEYCDQT